MKSLGERALGTYPLSIATSLAIEGAQGVHPDQPINKTILQNYPELWVNIRTLFRNYYNSVSHEYYNLFTTQNHRSTFLQEIIFLKDVVSQITSHQTKVIIYFSEYDNIQRLFKNPIMRVDSTENQIRYTKALTELLVPIVKESAEIIKTRQFIEHIDNKALIITHFPIDLFVKPNNGIDLLESHTGVIKRKQHWHTKYVNGKSIPQMPFRMDFLSIFGDNEMFRPNLMPYRKALIQLSEKYNWSHVTTKDKIIYGINTLTDKFLAANLKEMINHR